MLSKKKLVLILVTALIVFSIISYRFIVGNLFVYTNLVDHSSQDFAYSLLTEAGISQENIDVLFQLIEDFYQEPYRNIADNGFQKGLIPFFSYRDKDAFSHYNKQSDDTQSSGLLSCRMAAFILLKDSIVFHDEVDRLFIPEEKDPQSRQHLADTNDLLHFDTLFASLSGTKVDSSAQIASSLIEYWKLSGIVFSDDAKANMLTAYGASGGKIQNFHSAVVMKRDDGIWLFEKYNPIYPFQLSFFKDETQLVNYMKSRVDEPKYGAIFLGEDCLWLK